MGSNQCGSFGLRTPYSQVPARALTIAAIITVTPSPTSANSGPGRTKDNLLSLVTPSTISYTLGEFRLQCPFRRGQRWLRGVP
jgi:hypothetical protein